MILVDANVLLYAEDQESSHHVMAREWWDAQSDLREYNLNGTELKRNKT